MAKLKPTEVYFVNYCIVFFPIATYRRVGVISKLTVLGVKVYCRIDNMYWLCGFSWIGKADVKPT